MQNSHGDPLIIKENSDPKDKKKKLAIEATNNILDNPVLPINGYTSSKSRSPYLSKSPYLSRSPHQRLSVSKKLSDLSKSDLESETESDFAITTVIQPPKKRQSSLRLKHSDTSTRRAFAHAADEQLMQMLLFYDPLRNSVNTHLPQKLQVWDDAVFVREAKKIGFTYHDVANFYDEDSRVESLDYRDDCLILTLYMGESNGNGGNKEQKTQSDMIGGNKTPLMKPDEFQWMRMVVGIRQTEKQTHVVQTDNCDVLVALKEDSSYQYKSTQPFGALFKTDGSNYIATCLETAAASIRDYVRKIRKILIAKQNELSQTVKSDYCCMSSKSWPLPSDIHTFLDEVLEWELEIDEVQDHTKGLLKICDEILETIDDYVDDKKIEKHEWLVEAWHVRKQVFDVDDVITKTKQHSTLKRVSVFTEDSQGNIIDEFEEPPSPRVENLSKNEKANNKDLLLCEKCRTTKNVTNEKVKNPPVCKKCEAPISLMFIQSSKQKDCELNFREIKKDLHALMVLCRDGERRIERILTTIRIKIDLEDLMDNHTFTVMGMAFVIPTIIGGFWGMNCNVPFQADEDDPSIDTWLWIVGISGALVVLSICVLLFGAANSRYDCKLNPRGCCRGYAYGEEEDIGERREDNLNALYHHTRESSAIAKLQEPLIYE